VPQSNARGYLTLAWEDFGVVRTATDRTIAILQYKCAMPDKPALLRTADAMKMYSRVQNIFLLNLHLHFPV